MLEKSSEVPLLLCFSTGVFVCGVIGLYRNSVACKGKANVGQYWYGWLYFISACFVVLSYASGLSVLQWISSALNAVLLFYLLTSYFSPDVTTAKAITWSDVFLLGIFWGFYILKTYTLLLLIYYRKRIASFDKSKSFGQIKERYNQPEPQIESTARVKLPFV